MDKSNRLNLENLCRGGAEEIFQRDLDKVLENILDPNTPASAKRTITLKIEMEPAADRRSAIATFKSETKMCGVSAVKSTIYIQPQKDGSVEAYPENPDQAGLWPRPETDQRQ